MGRWTGLMVIGLVVSLLNVLFVVLALRGALGGTRPVPQMRKLR